MGLNRESYVFAVVFFLVISVFLVSIIGNNFVGFVIHPVYRNFSSPESSFSYNVNNNQVAVSDNIVYRTGYYSVNGSEWRSFTLEGSSYSLSSVWLKGAVYYSLPSLGEGEHYVIVYSCSYSNGWNCHDNRWQLFIINNTASENPHTNSSTLNCTNECSSLGLEQCSGSGYMICGNYNANDSCLEWSEVIACNSEQTCSSGKCITSNTNIPIGPTYYISTSGSDSSTRDGSSSSPWRTLAYACSRVTTSGSTIYVNSGTYIETQQCALAPGVNIRGAGVTSVIKSHYANAGGFEGIIKLISGSVTNGNQQISHIKLDGDNLQGYKAIGVYQRSNVKIHDLTIVDFRIEGIRFGGEGITTGNSIYNSIITNSCWYYNGDEKPCINVENTDGMQIYGNNITVVDRGDGRSATNIESFEGLTNCKIYNNKIINVPQIGGAWAFTIEIWASNGLDIYNNTITGAVDISGHVLSNNINFHHNTVGWGTLQAVYGDGIQIETRGADRNINISYNTFKNLERPIYFCHYDDSSASVENVWIYNNIIYNVGRSNANVGDGIYFESGPIPPAYERNINIWNNVIVASSNSPRSGIYLPTADEVSNVNIKNNIIFGFSGSPIIAAYQASGGSIDGLFIENNLFYNNGNSDSPKYSGITPSNIVYRNNLFGQNPLFVSSSDFHLQSESPAIDAGVDVNLPFSGNNPDLGAFEYR